MAVTKLSNSGIKTGVLKYDSMLAGNPPFIPTAFDSIATVTTSGGESSVTFSGISANYAHLQLRWTAKVNNTSAAGSTNMSWRFNGDSGTNYSYHNLYGFSNATATNNPSSTGTLEDSGITNTTALANTFASGILDIYDYAKNKNKTARALYGMSPYGDTGSFNYALSIASLGWRNTAAITSITITPNQAFVANCVFALYGIKE